MKSQSGESVADAQKERRNSAPQAAGLPQSRLALNLWKIGGKQSAGRGVLRQLYGPNCPEIVTIYETIAS